MPIPHISKRRKKKLEPPSKEPRRSRLIAGFTMETSKVCPTHLKKQVMRALGMDIEEKREKISQQILGDYTRSFKQPLPSSHTKALAALFGWALPEADYAAELVDSGV